MTPNTERLDPLERERIEILRDLKRVISLILENQHQGSQALNEDDPTVSELLVWIERSLWHGMRKTLLLKDNKSESESRKEKLTLWNIVRTLESRICKQILDLPFQTDSGRSRGWTRLALNQGVLGLVMSELKEGPDTNLFYEPVSIWRSTEQRSILLALLSSLHGMRFHLTFQVEKLDAEPDPSRRPHFLGVSSMQVQKPSGTFNAPALANFESKLRREREEKEVLEMKRKMSQPPPHHHQQQQQLDQPSSVLTWISNLWGSSGAASAPPPSPPPPPPIPPFLGSSLMQLVLDPRTSDEYCLLDYRLSLPQAISSLLALLRLENDEFDVFDPRHVKLEDDPRFVKEVANLIYRLSKIARQRKETTALDDEHAPSLLALACLRLFFRQLPEPVFPFASYDAFIACQQIGDTQARIRNIRLLVNSLPEVHKTMLCSVLAVIKEKCEAKQTNSISAANSLAPSLLRPRAEAGGFTRYSEGAELVTTLIEHYDEIFENVLFLQETRLECLKRKMDQVEELNRKFHCGVAWSELDQSLAKRLWDALYLPTMHREAMFGPISEGWLERGFRTTYFSYDFRGCGQSALEHVVYLCEKEPALVETMRHLEHFPLVAGAAQLSFMICELVGLDRKNASVDCKHVAKHSSVLWTLFAEVLFVERFFVLVMFVVAKEWTRLQVKAMEFNKFVRELRIRLEDILDQHKPRTLQDFRRLLQDADLVEACAVHELEEETRQDDVVDTVAEPAVPSDQDFDLMPRLHCPFAVVAETKSGILTKWAIRELLLLEHALPKEFQGYDWEMVYSSTAQGFNLGRFFSQAASHQTTLLVVLDTSGQVFGAFCNETWKNNGDNYYGSAQSFLFSLQEHNAAAEKELVVHRWTGKNNFFMLSNEECVALGQGEEGTFGIYIDGDLNKGTTGPCGTYGNTEPLIQKAVLIDGQNAEITCAVIELWSFVPKTFSKRKE